MNSNNYEVVFGENLSDKITKLKQGGEGSWTGSWSSI